MLQHLLLVEVDLLDEAAVAQVHDKEGQFAHHVNPAQLLVKLDSVKRGDALINDGEITEVQIAMALAYKPLPTTPCQQGLQFLMGLAAPLLNFSQLLPLLRLFQ